MTDLFSRHRTTLAALTVAVAVAVAVGAAFALSGRHDTGTTTRASAVVTIIEGQDGKPYSPDTIRVRAGQPFTVELTDHLGGCGLDTVFEHLGNDGSSPVLTVPVGATRAITLKAPHPGTYSFHCPSGMYTGHIIAD